MGKGRTEDGLVDLGVDNPIWERFFTVSPLVVIGTREGGHLDFAPKHMATRLGWENFFGFVCTPAHSTYQNIVQEKCFTVSFPRPDQIVLASLAASARTTDCRKPALAALPTFPARRIEGAFLRNSSLFLECELDRFVDGFGANSLIAGKIVEAHAPEEVLREAELDEGAMIHDSPLLAYLDPGRFARIEESYSFPFPRDFER